MKRITKFITTLLATFAIITPFVFAGVAAAQQNGDPGAPAPTGGTPPSSTTTQTNGATGNSGKDAVCKGVELTGGTCDAAAANSSVGNLIKQVINTLSVVIGVVSVIMIMIGGFKYITSNGDSNSIQSAKNTILYAIIGLVIVAVAQLIVVFVLGRVGKATGQQPSAPGQSQQQNP